MAKLGNRSMRNLSSAGWQSAKFTVGSAEKSAVGIPQISRNLLHPSHHSSHPVATRQNYPPQVPPD